MSEKLFGRPVARIRCAASEEMVGWLYEWNDGETQPAWIRGPVDHVTYEVLPAGKLPTEPSSRDPSSSG